MPDAAQADAYDAYVHALVRDWRAAPLTAVDRALCEYAAKLTRQPQAMTPSDLEALRAQSLDDVALHDAVQVIGYFNYINRLADALGVELEDFIPPWVSDRKAKREPPGLPLCLCAA